MTWDEKKFEKGSYGEKICSKYVIQKGYIPYIPEINTSHPFDKIIASPDKKKILIAEVKTKSRRNKYPDTGIDISHFKEYSYIMRKYNLPVFLFFVDEYLEKVYGNFLSKLIQEKEVIYYYRRNEHTSENRLTLTYPFKSKNGIIYFLLTDMKIIHTIPKEIANKMRKLSTRNYGYSSPYMESIFLVNGESLPTIQESPLLNSASQSKHTLEINEDQKTPSMEQPSKKINIHDIKPGMRNICLIGKVKKIDRIHSYIKNDGSKGKVGSFQISDGESKARVTLLNEKAEKLNNLQKNFSVEIIGASAKKASNILELCINNNGYINIIEKQNSHTSLNEDLKKSSHNGSKKMGTLEGFM
jgi:hypothetical protein